MVVLRITIVRYREINAFENFRFAYGTKPIQQKLQFLAVSGVKYSTLLGKELALHLQYVDKWKMSIVTGFTGEFSWPEYFINKD